MLKVEVLQPLLIPGDIPTNTQRVLEDIRSHRSSAKTPRLFLTGCETLIGMPRSMMRHFDSALIEQQKGLKKIQHSLGAGCAVIGGIQLNMNVEPLKLQNQIFFVTKNSVLHLLPDQYHTFETVRSFVLEDDVYQLDATIRYLGDYYYLRIEFAKPVSQVIHVCLHTKVKNFSPFSLAKLVPIFRAHCNGEGVYLANRIGMFNGQLQGGYSGYCGRNDEELALCTMPRMELPAQMIYDFPVRNVAFLHEALVGALRFFFRQNNMQKAILGLSGGLDSALVLEIAVAALGAQNVRAVIMPSPYTDERSVSSAQELAQNLGVATDIIPITPLVEAYLGTLAPFFADRPVDTTEENLQARIRAVLLMALSNKLGYVLLNTSNKSEIAVGYSTMYGDACGAISVIGSLYKTEVYEMSRWLNREKEVIPAFIIERPPSAELRPEQTDQDSLPSYEVLDAVLQELIDRGRAPQQLKLHGITADVVQKVADLLARAAYKRFQMPPCLRIAPDSFFDK